MKSYKLCLILFYLILSCKKDNEIKKNKLNLKRTGEIESYKIDNQTSINSFYKLNQIQNKDTTFIYFFDNYNNNILLYNTENKKKIQLNVESEGPNSVIKSSQNHLTLSLPYTKNKVIYEAAKKRFLFFNRDTIIKRVDLSQLRKKYLNDKVVEWYSPCIPENIGIHNSSLLFSVNNQLGSLPKKDIKGLYNFIVYDFVTSKLKSLILTPQEYLKGNWGHGSAVHTTLFHAFNQNRNKIVAGFSGLPYIYEIDVRDYTEKKYYFQSKFFDNVTPNIKDNRDRKEVRRFSALNGHYGPIYYDSFNKKYLRLVSHGVTEENYRNGKLRVDFSILVFDESFNNLGEIFFERGYEYFDPYKLYFKEDGVYISRVDLYNNDDNYFYFEKIEYKTKI